MGSFQLDEIAKDLRFILEKQPEPLQSLLRRIVQRIEWEADEHYGAELLADAIDDEADAMLHGEIN